MQPRIEQFREFEVHIYDDPRGDDETAWGVWQTQCGLCGRAINIVQKIDKPIDRLCQQCRRQAL